MNKPFNGSDEKTRYNYYVYNMGIIKDEISVNSNENLKLNIYFKKLENKKLSNEE